MFLCENQGIDFDDVRAAPGRFFGPEHSATIHDGDGCTLSGNVPGHYCAGTINHPSGATLATFAIDYIAEETSDGSFRRHVLAIHIGPRGQWCRNVSDGEAYDRWLAELAGPSSNDKGAAIP